MRTCRRHLRSKTISLMGRQLRPREKFRLFRGDFQLPVLSDLPFEMPFLDEHRIPWVFISLVVHLVYENILKWNNYIETNYERIICLREPDFNRNLVPFVCLEFSLSSNGFWHGVNRISVLSIKFSRGLPKPKFLSKISKF